MDCYLCWVNDKIKRPATMMAGQDEEACRGAYTYPFFPICDDHASTWTDAETVPYPMFKLRYMVNESSGNYMSLDHALRQHGNETVIYALNNGWTPEPVDQIVADWASQFHKPEDFMDVDFSSMRAFKNRESTVELLIDFWEHSAGTYLKST